MYFAYFMHLSGIHDFFYHKYDSKLFVVISQLSQSAT